MGRTGQKWGDLGFLIPLTTGKSVITQGVNFGIGGLMQAWKQCLLDVYIHSVNKILLYSPILALLRLGEIREESSWQLDKSFRVLFPVFRLPCSHYLSQKANTCG